MFSSKEAVIGKIEQLATYKGPGTIVGTVVGAGSEEKSECLYISFQYRDAALEIVAVDLNSGTTRVFTTPIPGIEGGSLLAHPNGKMYIGTWRPDRLLMLDPALETLVDLGRMTASESHLWGGMAVGADGKIYGGTVPSAKLIRHDPTTGKTDDLGRLTTHGTHMTSITCSSDGFVYATTGYSERHLIAYRISDGMRRELLPENYIVKPATLAGQATNVIVGKGRDGKIYAEVRDLGTLVAVFCLDGFIAKLQPKVPVAWTVGHRRLKDGREVVGVSPNELLLSTDKGEKSTVRFTYTGKELSIFRLGLGPDQNLYGCPYQSGAELFRVSLPDTTLTRIGRLGTGELAAFASVGSSLFMAGYYTRARVLEYRPSGTFEAGVNPLDLDSKDLQPDWRPQQLVMGPNQMLYGAAGPGYGGTTGRLYTIDASNHRILDSYGLFDGEYPATLARWGDYVVGGTATIDATKVAQVFLWDTVKRAVAWQQEVPIPNTAKLTGFVVTGHGLLIGLAIGADSRAKLIAYDLQERRLVHQAAFPFVVHPVQLYNAQSMGPDGKIWGLATNCVYSVDTITYQVRQEAPYLSGAISSGFAINGRELYFGSVGKVLRYTIPETP